MSLRVMFWGVFVLALLLRLFGINYGLPFIYHQDEPIMVNRAFAIGASGDWNPHFFTNGPFPIYSLFFIYGALFVFGKAFSFFADKTDFALHFLKDPTPFYLSGRLFLGAILGTLTVVWLAIKSRNLFRSKIGVAAGFFLAASLIHVQSSHYIYSDTPLTLAATILFFALIAALKRPTVINFFLAGLPLGLGLACKMTAAYFVPSALFVWVLLLCSRTRPIEFKPFYSLLGFGLGTLLVFFILSPYVFLDWENFLKQMIIQKGAEGSAGITFHLRYSLLQGVGLPVLLLAVLGAYALYKTDQKVAVFTVFFILTFYLFSSIIGMRFARRILPLVPPLCFLAAWGWEYMRARIQTSIGTLIGILLAVGMLIPALYSDYIFAKEDTRTLCHKWITEHVIPGTTLVVDNRFFGPHLSQTIDLIEAKESVLTQNESEEVKTSTYISNEEINKVRGKRLELMKQAIDPKKAYRVYLLSHQEESKALPLFMLPIVKLDKEEIQKIKAEYIVFSYAEYQADVAELKKSYGEELELQKTFSPYISPAQKFSYDKHELAAAPVTLREIFSRKSLGPYIELYKITERGK